MHSAYSTKDEAAAALAAQQHEDWRRTRLNPDGSYEPRVKPTKDATWSAARGAETVDIANTTFADLPRDWQEENQAAAEVVVDLLWSRPERPDLSDPETRAQIGEEVHAAWLTRNTWANGGELDVPFIDLPAEEQEKDIDQVRKALELF